MFAVIKTGGKQYKVAKDDIVVVEKLAAEVGASVTLEPVLMLGGDGAAQVGTPAVEGASVAAEVLEQTRGPKIRVFKKKRRKNYRRMRGHRQEQTLLRVTDILTDGKKPAKKAETAEEKPAAKKQPGARAQQKAVGQTAASERGKAKAATAARKGAAGGSKAKTATAKKGAAASKAKAGAGIAKARQTGTKKQAAAKPGKQSSSGSDKSRGKSASKGGSTADKKKS